LADQIKSLDWRARRARFECRAERQVVGEVLEKVNVLLE
jgi:mRNA interferase MazF